MESGTLVTCILGVNIWETAFGLTLSPLVMALGVTSQSYILKFCHKAIEYADYFL